MMHRSDDLRVYPYALPWLCPVPHCVAESGVVPDRVSGFLFAFHGFPEEEEERLRMQAADMGLAAQDGLPLDFVHGAGGPAAAGQPAVDEAEVLRNRPGAYWIDLAEASCTVRVGSYEGAVHALVRLTQWLGLSDDCKQSFRMLDFPMFAFRGINRDDEESWSLDYWDRTIRYARNLFLNRLGISAERAFLAYARKDTQRYNDFVGRFHAIRDKGAEAGIGVMPMFYNVDHMLGQFLKAAGREDLCRMANRVIIRYELPEAWEVALDLCVSVLTDLAPRSFVIWASETSHEDHGVEGLPADEQWAAEAGFCAELLRRVRERAGEVSLVAILSQGCRERVESFTGACRGLPVQFVQYDGEWTYCMPCPLSLPPALVRRSTDERGVETTMVSTPPLTTWHVEQSLERGGVPWLGKPAWVRIAYLGLPYLRPAAVIRECEELLAAGYCGMFPNASRWGSNPWIVSLGSAAAWGAGRTSIAGQLERFFKEDFGPGFAREDIQKLESIWVRMSLLNTPMEAAPRLSAFRSTLYNMAFFLQRACLDPEFTISDFEEIYFVHTWQREAGWLREAMEQIERWKPGLNMEDREATSLWPHSIRVLEPLLALHAHLLAAAYIVCREYSPDNSKGPWHAWRRLLAWHLEKVDGSIEGVLAFEPLDAFLDRGSGALETAFDQPGEIPLLYGFKPVLREMQTACLNVRKHIESPAAFSALKTRKGLDGEWPRNGLYECLNWPVKKS